MDEETSNVGAFFERASASFLVFVDKHTQRIVRISTCGMMLIHALRRPTWTYFPEHRENYTNLNDYPGWGISRLNSSTSYTLDMIFCFFSLQATLRILKIESLSKTRDRTLRYVTVPLCVLKILECMVQIPLALANQPRVFIASPIEAIILFTSEPAYEGSLFSTMYRSLPYYFGLIIILVCVIISWSTLGMIIISNNPTNPDPSFQSLSQSVWTMLNVLNTANWPSPIISSYNRAPGYFFFFLFYSVVADWGFLNLILGLIVAFFESSWEKKLGKERERAESNIDNASVDGPPATRQMSGGVISSSKAEGVSEIFNPMKITTGTTSVEASEGDEVNQEEAVHPSVAKTKTRADPSSSQKAGDGMDENNSKPDSIIEKVRYMVNSKAFDVIMDTLLLTIAVSFISTPYPKTFITLQISLNVVELVFRFLFLPQGMKLAEWIQQPRCLSNLSYIVCLVSSTVAYLTICKGRGGGDCAPEHLNESINWRMNSEILFFIMMIRATILIRSTFVLRNVSWDVLPAWVQRELSRCISIVNETFKGFMHLVFMLFLIMYIFACIGMMLYGGGLSKNPKLVNYHELMESPYAELGYWPLNFNDLPSAMVSMFTLLYVNNMYVLASGCAAVTSNWSEIFFSVYYLLGVLYLRNIFTSFLWSRIGKILDRSYMPIQDEDKSKNDVFSKMTNIFQSCMARYDQALKNTETSKKAKSRTVHAMIDAEMSLIESTGVLLQYSRLGEAHTLFTKRSSLLAFRLRYKYVYPLLGCCWLITLLRVYQKPYWLIDDPLQNDEMNKYYLDNAIFMPPKMLACIKVPLFSVVIVALFAELIYKADGTKRLKQGHVSVLFRYALIALSSLSVVCCIGSALGSRTCQKIDWIMSFCSVYYNLWFDRHALKRLIILVGVAPTLFALVSILFLFILVSAGFSYFVFYTKDLGHDDDINNDYFGNYDDAIWNTLMAITSSSFPSQFVPAYRAYREYAFYFVPLIIVGGFVFLEGSIAVVNTAYQTRSDALQHALAANRESVMSSAFDALRHETGVRIVEETIVAKTIETETITERDNAAHAIKQDVSSPEPDDSAYSPGDTRIKRNGNISSDDEKVEKVVNTRRVSALDVSGLSAIDGRSKKFYNTSHKGEKLAGKLDEIDENSHQAHNLVDRLTQGADRISMVLMKNATVSELKNVRAEACIEYDDEKEEISSIISTDFVHGSVMDDLFAEIFANYNDFFKFNFFRTLLDSGGSKSNRAHEVTTIMRNILDVDGDGKIGASDFRYLLIICRLKFALISEHEMDFVQKRRARKARREEIDQQNRTASLYESIKYQLWYFRCYLFLNIKSGLQKCSITKDMKKSHWEIISDSITGVLAIACCLSWRSSGESTATHQNLLDVLFFTITLELILKVLFMSHYHYWSEWRNKVDFAVWLSFAMLTFIAMFHGKKHQLSQYDISSESKFEHNVAFTRELIIVIRILLFPRNVALMANPVNGVAWESVLTTIGALTFAFAEGFISFYFTYTQLGVLIFGGTMTREGYNEELDASRFGIDKYYVLNFNDMVSAFSTLFCALRISDFDVITEGFSIVTSKYARLYFVLWYIFGVLLFFNVLKSYFISVFQPREEHSSSKSQLEQRGSSDSNSSSSEDQTQDHPHTGEDQIPSKGPDNQGEEGGENGEYLSVHNISVEELEARNLNGEILIDYYDILTNPKYVDGKIELENEVYRASGVSRRVQLPEKRKCKYVVSLPFKVTMDAQDREVVLRRLYALSLNELKIKVDRRAHSFYERTDKKLSRDNLEDLPGLERPL